MKKIACIALFLALLVSTALAATFPCTGTVAWKGVNVRKKAARSSDIITELEKGTKLTVLESETNKVGDTWYHVQLKSGRRGYIMAKYINLDSSASSSTAGASSYEQQAGSTPTYDPTNPYSIAAAGLDPYAVQSSQNPYGTAANPYGAAANPYGTAANPYGTAANPYGTASNPYGTAANSTNPYATTGTSTSNPYATTGSTSANPYATTGSTSANPYATTGSTSANPYATTDSTSANPYATTGTSSANPYGTATSGTNPYAAADSSTTAANPYAASGTSSANPYASTGTSTANPYGTATTATGMTSGAPVIQANGNQKIAFNISVTRNNGFDIGTNWAFVFEVNGERVPMDGAYATFNPGETYTFTAHVRQTENGQDLGVKTTEFIPMNYDLQDGFTVEQEVNVTYMGQPVIWKLTWGIEPNQG